MRSTLLKVRPPMRSHFELRIWKEAHALTLDIYRLTASFPTVERFGLVVQMRKASASVAAVIAEGSGRGTKKDLVHFLFMARGSAHEMTSHLALARDVGYGGKGEIQLLINRYEGLAAGIFACIEAVKPKK
jgi:four helix bundle protein